MSEIAEVITAVTALLVPIGAILAAVFAYLAKNHAKEARKQSTESNVQATEANTAVNHTGVEHPTIFDLVLANAQRTEFLVEMFGKKALRETEEAIFDVQQALVKQAKATDDEATSTTTSGAAAEAADTEDL